MKKTFKKNILGIAVATAFSGAVIAADTTILSDSGLSGLTVQDNAVNAQTYDPLTSTVNTVDTGSNNIIGTSAATISSQNINNNSYAEVGVNSQDDGVAYIVTRDALGDNTTVVEVKQGEIVLNSNNLSTGQIGEGVLITNVANAVNDNQATNLGQVKELIGTSTNSLSTDISNLENQINNVSDIANSAALNASNATSTSNQALLESQNATTLSQEAINLSNEANQKSDLAITASTESLLTSNQSLQNSNDALANSQQALLDSQNAASLANQAILDSSVATSTADLAITMNENLSVRVDSLESNVGNLQGQVGAVETLANNTATGLTALTGTVAGVQNQVTDVANNVSNLQGQVGEVQSLANETAGKVVVIDGKVNAISEQVDKYNTVISINNSEASFTKESSVTGNRHGITITNEKTIITGGTKSTQMTLDDNKVSFSHVSSGQPVIISGVQDGIEQNDAVNKKQLDQSIMFVTEDVNRLGNKYDNLRNHLNQVEGKLNQVEQDAYRGIASLAAINNAPVPRKVGGYSLAIGAGSYKSESAIGLSFAYRGGSNTGYAVISGGVGYATSGDPVYKAGVAWEY